MMVRKKQIADIYSLHYNKKFALQLDDFVVDVERKWIKTIRLSISKENAHAHLSAPAIMTDKQIKDFLTSKIDWIRENKVKMEKLILADEKQYWTGDTIYFLGNPYTLCIINRDKPPKIEVEDDKINVYCRPQYTVEMRKTLIREWYRRQLYVILPPFVAKWENILKVKTAGIQVNQAQTLWGSCNVRTHHVHFSINLARKPLRCIEYVVAHELTHLIVRGHNDKFYSILDGSFEDAAEVKRMLKQKEGY